MIYILTGIIAVLAIVNVIQYRMRRSGSGQLTEIADRLRRLSGTHSKERLLLMTDDGGLKQLLVQLNRLLDDNERLTAQFKATERSMKKMLANFSHDLKTPLTVVLGYAEMLQGERANDPVERNRLLQLILVKTQEIIELMNGFFDLARLEAGDKDIPLARVHVIELCKTALLSFYEMVQEKGLQADIRIPEKPVYALGNEEAIGRVLGNLLSNAIQYGSEGKSIGLSVSYDDAHVTIEVSDRGRGISVKDQTHVFERMFTLEESRNKAFQGSGLGLAITKRLVEEMGGEIKLSSVPYEKTVFSFSLKRIDY